MADDYFRRYLTGQQSLLDDALWAAQNGQSMTGVQPMAPTLRDRATDYLRETFPNTGWVQRQAPNVTGLLDWVPGVGNVVGVQEGGQQFDKGMAALNRGDYRGGAINTALGGLGVIGSMIPGGGKSGKAASEAGKIIQTVTNPKRLAYPGIYMDPRKLVDEAARRVAPEDPVMKRLFGVTRDDLYEIGGQGARQGNMEERPFRAGEKARGAAHAADVTGPENTQRLQDIIVEAKNRAPQLFKPMASWYVQDPLFQWYERNYGREIAEQMFSQINHLMGMASPGSEVLTEINRGTAANWLATQGRFDDFMKYGGMSMGSRGANYPEDMRAVLGHAYHKTAQALPMQNYLNAGGKIDMNSAKVPSYIPAGGVPETGFQTDWPVGDAHFSRLTGLPDVRGTKTEKGVEVTPGASATVPEMLVVGPWFKNQVAGPLGLAAVPGQGVLWGAGSGATGVTSPIGAPKLELLSQQIAKAANRMGVSPETARDLILSGKAHAGFARPDMLPWLAGAGAGGLLGLNFMSNDEQK